MSQSVTVKSADRTLQLLELFADRMQGLTLTDVCDETGWPKSSTLGLLRTLQARSYLDFHDGTGHYRLGPRVANLGAIYLDHLDLAKVGAEVVREISRTCDETVHLAVLRNTEVLYVAKEEGGGRMRIVSMIGRTVPAHGTGVGKVLLSALDPTTFSMRFPPGQNLPQLTERTIGDYRDFLDELAAIRARGYATDHGESTLGIECLAAPVLDARGETVAAISISVPGPRFTPERRPHLLETLLAGVRTLSLRLGCPPMIIDRALAPAQHEVLHGHN
jgi:IclR family transcriptional regulator, KDG regulon repressor